MADEAAYAEIISEFLSFLREADEQRRISTDEELLANGETQDILHRLELDDGTTREDAALAALLRDVRRRRRRAKDTKEITTLISSWADSQKTAIRSLEQLLGTVRKLEKHNKERFYGNRTTILEKNETFECTNELDIWKEDANA